MIYGERSPRRERLRRAESPKQRVRRLAAGSKQVTWRNLVHQARIQGAYPGLGTRPLDVFCRVAPTALGVMMALGVTAALAHLGGMI